jgi:hypothetical protein
MKKFSLSSMAALIAVSLLTFGVPEARALSQEKMCGKAGKLFVEHFGDSTENCQLDGTNRVLLTLERMGKVLGALVTFDAPGAPRAAYSESNVKKKGRCAELDGLFLAVFNTTTTFHECAAAIVLPETVELNKDLEDGRNVNVFIRHSKTGEFMSASMFLRKHSMSPLSAAAAKSVAEVFLPTYGELKTKGSFLVSGGRVIRVGGSANGVYIDIRDLPKPD